MFVPNNAPLTKPMVTNILDEFCEPPALAGRVKDFVVIYPLGRRIKVKPALGPPDKFIQGEMWGMDAQQIN